MASSSSSWKRKRNHDVFLSFRGTDVRNNILSHLYSALDKEGISAYTDSDELRKGELMSPALINAIEESEIAIIVFSENYASSPWCLEEVAKIMECKEQRNLMVFPVFYKVEPQEVRTPRQSYQRAMAKHEAKFGKDSEKVKRWKKALFDAGCLSGLDFNDGDEAEFIQRIVHEISTQLARPPWVVAQYPVGLDCRVQELKTILNRQTENDVLMVGLWGKGGVGKTTLVKAIYNAVFREFQHSSFLERVRENSKNYSGLVHLQEQLLSEVLLGKNLTVFGVDRGICLIRERLCNKKVLIILDDVDDISQLHALVGGSEWFSKGSRIIITTRNRHLLTCHLVDHIYEVKAFEDDEAFELFRKHAFPGNQEIEIRSDLVDSALHYAGGLPLALVVLGSFLCGRGEDEWESTMRKLRKSSHKKINDVLKVGYEGLEDDAKEIFLDIACFFKGWSKWDIKKVLDSCDFDTTLWVQILIECTFISEKGETLQIDDLTQLMGRNIVKEEYRDDPSKWSRIWCYDDFLNVLSRDEGTNAIKAIVLELPKPKETYIGPNAFANMRKLRLLILRNVHNSFQGPIHLPNQLMWFEWPHCASILEFSHGPKEGVGLDMQNSKIEEGPGQYKDFKKLKFINFSECQSLVCMPDLDYTPYLEELDLRGCKNLEQAHESVAFHGKLRLLNLSGCSKLHLLPHVLQVKNLELLNFNHCSKLQRFPDIPDKMKGLRGLYLIGTSIEELPTSIENLVSLEEMDLRYCKKLVTLPSSIYRLQNLERLTLEGCSKLVKFPKKEEDPSDSRVKMGFPKLYVLNLRGCNLSEVEFLENHSCFPFLRALYLLGNNFTGLSISGELHNLLWLDVSYCQQVQEIPYNPRQLSHLWAIGCESLSKFPPHKCNIEALLSQN